MILNEKDKFEKKVKRNYTEATVYLCRFNSKYFDSKNHRRIEIMQKGKLKDTENAEKWWKAKVEKAWGRRCHYSGI